MKIRNSVKAKFSGLHQSPAPGLARIWHFSKSGNDPAPGKIPPDAIAGC